MKTTNKLNYHQKCDQVYQCKNARKGEFFYGTEKCWFQQNETENQENNENQNRLITSKLVDMMEMFTNRIT